MTYVIKGKTALRNDFVRLTDGIAHFTDEQLGRDYPHLVKHYKTRAAAQGTLTRILRKYSDNNTLANYDFSIHEVKT
jgi:hypothetical protein